MGCFGAIAEAHEEVKQLRSLVLSLARSGNLTDTSKAESLRIGDLVYFRQDLLRPGDGTDADVTFVGPQHIDRDTGRRNGCEKLHSSELKGRKFRFSTGDIVYTYLRPYLNKVWIADISGVCSVDQYVLKVDSEQVLGRFVQLIMLGPRFLSETKELTHSLQLPRLRSGLLSKIKIPVPPLAEQKRIVAKVDQLMAMLDDLEQRQEKRRSAAIHVSKASLDSLVNAEDPDQLARAWERVSKNFGVVAGETSDFGRLRQAVLAMGVLGRLGTVDAHDSPVSTLVHSVDKQHREAVAQKLTKDPPRQELPTIGLPTSWVWASLGSLLVFGPRNGTSPRPVSFPTPTKSLILGATTSGTFDGTKTKYIDLKVDTDSFLWLRPGDILVQRGNTIEYVGVAALYSGAPHKYIYPDLMMKIRVAEALCPAFIHLAMSEDRARDFLRSRASGTSGNMPKINQRALLSLPLPVPPYAEQKRIVKKVNALMALIDQLEDRSRRLQQAASTLAIAATRAS